MTRTTYIYMKEKLKTYIYIENVLIVNAWNLNSESVLLTITLSLFQSFYIPRSTNTSKGQQQFLHFLHRVVVVNSKTLHIPRSWTKPVCGRWRSTSLPRTLNVRWVGIREQWQRRHGKRWRTRRCRGSNWWWMSNSLGENRVIKLAFWMNFLQRF